MVKQDADAVRIKNFIRSPLKSIPLNFLIPLTAKQE